MSSLRQIVRIAVGLALLGGVVPIAVGQNSQDASSPGMPGITFSLPAGSDSEAVRISYFMTGDFGGFGSFIRTEKDRLSYEMVAEVDGKLASRIKVIAYLPGCEIVTIDTPIEPTSQSLELPCHPLSTITVHGQIPSASIKGSQSAVIEVTYVALWSLRFFGIADGHTETIPIGTAVPDSDGQFEVQLPDYARQNGLGEGAFRFSLRQSKDGFMLKPSLEADENGYLKVSSSYPPLIPFLVEKP